jgi:hypothetical protein
MNLGFLVSQRSLNLNQLVQLMVLEVLSVSGSQISAHIASSCRNRITFKYH